MRTRNASRQDKTKIVYCNDSNHPGSHASQSFDFLEFTFRPRRARNHQKKEKQYWGVEQLGPADTLLVSAWQPVSATGHRSATMTGRNRESSGGTQLAVNGPRGSASPPRYVMRCVLSAASA
ncbi:hypothetical protein ACVIHH_000009 [Bradyrhizobium sp. USDA 4518]